ncbi:hypothetical protein [Actinoplanes sp. CA-252034]|uniref:hypothetical protein n=1 Tax=Actinoplanes sp. CA-252034 TaxID=3239906 RepID=UPI003D965610
MRRRTAAGIVAAGAVAAVALGSGLTAWAGWAVGTSNGAATLRGETLPSVGKPEAVLNGAGVPRVSWVGVEFPSGAAVGGYAVTRHVGAVRVEVCRVAAATSTCTDLTAEPGSSVTYTVRAVAGDRWAGAASPKSGSLTVPGGATAAKRPTPAVTDSDMGAGKKVVSDGGGDGVDGAAATPTSPAPGPPSSAPSATAGPATSSASPSPSVTAGGEGGGAG